MQVSTKNAGMRWQSPAIANRNAESARYRPVRRPRMAKPRYRTANDRLIEKANSPAIVDVMLPPMMLP